MTPVIAVERSDNQKLGKGQCSATYVGQASCPADCPFLGAGCYAEHGPLGIHTDRLNQSRIQDSLGLAKLEAKAIAGLSGKRPLRLHVVGDCRTEGATRLVERACGAYRARGGHPTWTYTHAWDRVRRVCWGSTSVLASVQSLVGAWKAWCRGYAPALVVPGHPPDGRAWKADYGFTVIPCPAQTRGRTCAECKLCFNADALHQRRAVIAFEAHGTRAGMVREALG